MTRAPRVHGRGRIRRAPENQTVAIVGQCHGCTCPIRASDFTTDTFGITVRRSGTCRRDQQAINDLISDVSE